MKILSRFTFDKVKFDQENGSHLVLSFTAPKIGWQKKRPAISIISAVDISGSMGGPKIEYAKQSQLKLLDHLQPGDFFGLVVFGSAPGVVCAPVEITQTKKDELKKQIGTLDANGGGTNFSGGLLLALDLASKLDLPQGVNTRVIMFTDGQANEGVATTIDALLSLQKANLGKASVSAFGYGSGADQNLMDKLSAAGNGNYAFIAKPEDALTAFGKELGGLISSYATNIKISVSPNNEHKIDEVVSDVNVKEDGDKVQVDLGDLLAEETRHVVFKMTLAKQAQALPRAMSVADISISYDVIGEDGKIKHEKEDLKAKISFVKDGTEQTKPTKEIDVFVAMAQAVQAQVEAEKLADRGDYKGASLYMASVSDNFGSRGHDGWEKTAGKIGSAMASASSYGNTSSYRSSMKRGVMRSMTLSSTDHEASVDLADLGTVLSNSVQETTASSFSHPTVESVVGSINNSAVVAPPDEQEVQAATASKKSKKGAGKSRSKRW